MPLNIKNPDADRLARELAALTGESITEAVVEALEQRLVLERARRKQHGLRREVQRIQERLAAIPAQDNRPADVILGYDDAGLPA